MPYAKNKGSDQPAHPRSPISTFVIRCLDSLISLVSISEISSLPSFCVCAGRFESYLVENPEDRFSRDETHIIYCMSICLTISALHTSAYNHRKESLTLELNRFPLVFSETGADRYNWDGVT